MVCLDVHSERRCETSKEREHFHNFIYTQMLLHLYEYLFILRFIDKRTSRKIGCSMATHRKKTIIFLLVIMGWNNIIMGEFARFVLCCV